MSDFIPRETLPDLWEEILQTHWTFLETEESIQKLEERKKLEGCLKEFLCIVPHDRKFFLPETAHVLKKSVKEMTDFSAYKAMIGFESISQYANNLFTKPWRKEYRVIKMYSGFYQHEIKSNLIDADKLFEAMGYKQFPNQILMLDGPICPDQVTNVSRDAMAAYVECQIMKNIFSGLTSMQLSCSWLDIYNFREIHTGGITQAVKSMAYVIQERKYRKEKTNSENCYSAIQPISQSTIGTITGSCPSCSHACQQQFSNSCSIHHMTPAIPLQQQTYTSVCSIHPQQNIYIQQQNNVPIHNYKTSSSHHNYHPPSQMSHSKSLEHYVDHVIPPSSVLPHRHSFDQPHYDSTAALISYDCLDSSTNGGITNNGSYQSCNLNTTYNHPYNVSGNRYPLPYNISTQLNNQLQSIGVTTNGNCMAMSGMVGHYPPPPLPPPPPPAVNYGNSGNNNHKILEHDHVDCNNSVVYGKNQKMCNYHHIMSNGKDLINYRPHHQYNYNSSKNLDQLIDFDERLPTLTNDYIENHKHRNHHSSLHGDTFDYTSDRQKAINLHHHHHQNITSHYDIPRSSVLKDLNSSNSKSVSVVDANDQIDDNYHLYSSVTSNRNEKKSTAAAAITLRHSTDKYIRNAEILEQYQKIIDNNEQKSSTGCGTHDSYDSYEEITGKIGSGGNVSGNIVDNSCNDSQQQQSSKISKNVNKNQDGVGSFESWDYVFQNLEKHGYNKDLGERGDLLVQGLDLDLMNINGAIDKRRSRNLENTKSLRQTTTVTNDNIKSKSIEKKQQDCVLTKQDLTTMPSKQSKTIAPKPIESITTTKRLTQQQVSKSTQKAQIQKTSKITTIQNPSSSKTVVINNNNLNEEQSLRSTLHRLSSNGILVAAHCHVTDAATGTNGISDNNGSGNVGSISNSLPSSSLRSSSGGSNTKITASSTATVTSQITCGPNEWSCRFCTYLNPDTKRICEMCCRSKDFILDTTNAPTCV